MLEKDIIKLDKARTVKERNGLVYSLYGIWAILTLWFSSSLLVVFIK